MKHLSIIILAIIFGFKISAQESTAFLTNIDITVYSPGFEKSKRLANEFLTENSSQILLIEDKEDRLLMTFFMEGEKQDILNALLPKLGFVQRKNVKTTNYDDQIAKDNHKLEYLQNKKVSYANETESMDTKDERYYDYWREI